MKVASTTESTMLILASSLGMDSSSSCSMEPLTGPKVSPGAVAVALGVRVGVGVGRLVDVPDFNISRRLDSTSNLIAYPIPWAS